MLTENLERAASRWPNRVALVNGDQRLTYSGYLEAARRLGWVLHGFGVRPGDSVAVILPNTLTYGVAYYGITLIGAVLVPVNPAFKGPEMAYILADSAARVIITVPALLGMLTEIKPDLPDLKEIISLGPNDLGVPELASLMVGASDQPFPISVGSEAPAACLYTSGTTGWPKGALLTHGNLTFDAAAVQGAVELREHETLLAILPLFHSFAEMVNLVLAVDLGATVVILDGFRPAAIFEAIARERVSILAGVPSQYAALTLAYRETVGLDLSSLYLAVSGGAALPLEILQRFEATFGIPLLEGNGPTETGPVSYVNPWPGPRKAGSVGPPLPGVRVRIVDDEGQERPEGEIGEIAVAGPNVMLGYLNRPTETAEVLREGWFHTGDLGYRDQDGYIFIVDRKKDLIIVGGLNVYPREVEELLLTHPKVAEAGVVAAVDQRRGEAVKAVICLKPGEESTPREIIQFCRQHLANYKVPRLVEFRANLPKTATGKVLKKALREGF